MLCTVESVLSVNSDRRYTALFISRRYIIPSLLIPRYFFLRAVYCASLRAPCWLAACLAVSVRPTNGQRPWSMTHSQFRQKSMSQNRCGFLARVSRRQWCYLHWRLWGVSWRRNCSPEVFLIPTTLPPSVSDRYSVRSAASHSHCFVLCL